SVDESVLRRAADHAVAHLASLPDRPVGARTDVAALRAALDRELPDHGVAPEQVIDDLVADAGPGLNATPGPRFFGFVIGGAQPAALAADWLVGAWDQNAALYVASPAAAVIEEVAAGWALDVLGLPPTASVGFVTGGQMANATCLAAARHAVLARAGWDVEAHGLAGAPPLDVYVGEQAHVTVFAALRLLGLGAGRAVRIAADDQGRMLPEALAAALAAGNGLAIVCAQAGEINTGAFDPLEPIVDAVAAHGAWLHVDGAFGLWAAASPRRAALVRGLERADSWVADAHKWLNVPYDSSLAIVADPAAHVAAMNAAAAYLPASAGGVPDPSSLVPELSRRARGVPVYAALRALGRAGLAELVDRCCDLAAEMAEALAASGRFRIINDVVLNQALAVPEGIAGEDLPRLAAAIQAEGTCWIGPTVHRGTPALRVSVSNWSTTSEDIARSAAAIIAAADGLRS
ncbi:MAG TPA: pyridoxal-dependent decarboxylase, partial [Solirubrobacteraceae bacterium]